MDKSVRAKPDSFRRADLEQEGGTFSGFGLVSQDADGAIRVLAVDDATARVRGAGIAENPRRGFAFVRRIFSGGAAIHLLNRDGHARPPTPQLLHRR